MPLAVDVSLLLMLLLGAVMDVIVNVLSERCLAGLPCLCPVARMSPWPSCPFGCFVCGNRQTRFVSLNELESLPTAQRENNFGTVKSNKKNASCPR